MLLTVVSLSAILFTVATSMPATVQLNSTLQLKSFWFKGLPEESMNAVQLITYNGYPVQEFVATTEDGYKLTMQRIPYGRNGPPSCGQNGSKRPVVLLQHGLLASSTCWLTNLANESLAYILADAGMDVFLGNFRGNTYSRAHVSLNPDKDHAFWEFSWDEMAKYDIPTQVNAALEKSGADSLYYVGHSEGTMTAFAQFSQDLVFAQKIKHFFALAPVAKVNHIKGLLQIIGSNYKVYEWLIKLIDNNEFLPNTAMVDYLGDLICGSVTGNPLCANLFFLIGGPNTDQLNATRLPVYTAHNPAGTSTQNMIHFAQGVRDNTFRMFDYGTAEKNEEVYKQKTPPDYHPERMTVPVSLFSGSLDWLADPLDVLWLMNQLKSIANNYAFVNYNHLDFIWGMNAPVEIYSKIVNIINAK